MSDSPAVPTTRTTAAASSEPPEYPPGAYPRAIIQALGDSGGPLTLAQVHERVAEMLPSNRRAELENDIEALLREGSLTDLPQQRAYTLSEAGRRRYEGMVALAAE